MQKCKVCESTGWEIIEIDNVNYTKRCSSCFQKRSDKKRFELALIPSRYEHCSFGSFYPTHPTQRNAKSIAMKFVEEYPADTNSGLLFMGPCGVGKTHLAVAAMREIINKGFSCVFYDFRDLLKKIQYSYKEGSEISEYEVLKPVLERDILLLDELGAQKITSWIRDTLTHIINRRYNDNKITIITSNYLDNPSKMRKDEENLSERIGCRLRSRLNEMCRVVIMDGKDFRMEFRQKSLQAQD